MQKANIQSPIKISVFSQTNYQHIQNQRQSQIQIFDQLKKTKKPNITVNGKSFDTISNQGSIVSIK